MNGQADVDRRQMLTAGVGLLLSVPAVANALPHGRGNDRIDPEKGVTAPEDLMKEHGVLNRCLLIYEEGIRRLRDRAEVRPEVFNHTATLIRKFVEEYHEKNEEKYIFPVFVKANKMTDLVQTLKTQHRAGRKLT